MWRSNGSQLGYLSAALAADVARRLGQGYRYAAYLAEVTGGEPGKPTLGANLLIVVAEPGVDDEAVLEYMNSVIASDEAVLADLGVEGLTAVPQDDSHASAERPPAKGTLSGAELVQLFRNADLRDGFIEEESEEPDELRRQGLSFLKGCRGFMLWAWRGTVKTAAYVDRTLRALAGEGNDIIYRFLQVLCYAGVPALLLFLILAILAL